MSEKEDFKFKPARMTIVIRVVKDIRGNAVLNMEVQGDGTDEEVIEALEKALAAAKRKINSVNGSV